MNNNYSIAILSHCISYGLSTLQPLLYLVINGTPTKKRHVINHNLGKDSKYSTITKKN